MLLLRIHRPNSSQQTLLDCTVPTAAGPSAEVAVGGTVMDSLWDLLRNKMLIIRDVIYAQCSKDSPFSSLEKPCCLHNGAVNGAGTGCRKTALHHGLGNCDHSKNIISVTTGPRLNFASLRARVSHRNQHLHCSFPLNHFDTVTISQFYLRTA